MGELSAVTISLPSLPEQRAIARILGSLDDKIELNRRMNATLESLAQTLFRAWFVDFEPVKAKAAGLAPVGLDPETAALFPSEFEDSALGPIPKGWKIKLLSEVTTVITKGTTPTQQELAGAPDSDSQINYVRVNCIGDNSSILQEKIITIPESVHNQPLKRSILHKGDLLYTIAGTIGRTVIVEEDLLPANTNQAVAIIRPRPAMPADFLLLTMQNRIFQLELHHNVVHAVQANLSLGMLSKAKATFPPEPLLNKVFEPIGNILEMVRANRKQSRTLEQIRDALLPRLISGQLRVPDADAII